MEAKKRNKSRVWALIAGVTALAAYFGMATAPLASWILLGTGIIGTGGALLVPSRETRLKMRESREREALPGSTGPQA